MTSTLNALDAARNIEASYRRYLLSTFRPRTADLAAELEHALTHDVALTKGPYLQATPAFEHGAMINGLIEEGVLSEGIRQLPAPMFQRPLYRHQEEAIRKAVAGRNLIVATGTGSGKTESFLLPIVNGLMREREAGTLNQPGVRALLLYPMNALANDQVKRLRSLLADVPDITFGRYVGETPHDEKKAETEFSDRYPGEPRLTNELIARDQMQAAPPHILLTNFAMLEYLLLRPNDSNLFDGPTGEFWRHIVLDEAHVYGGAQGAEVAMLLRRVKDRVVQSRRGALQVFATSATLGAGRDDYPALLKFGETLFGEPFTWEANDDAQKDIIEAYRLPLVQGESKYELSGTSLQQLDRLFRDDSPVEVLSEFVASQGITPIPDAALQPDRWLYELMRYDKRLVAVQAAVQHQAIPLEDLAERMFEDPQDLVALVDLAVAAKQSDDANPLLPARYHYFVRALEAAQICLHPAHLDGDPRLTIHRSDSCPSCRRREISASAFELGVCRTCRIEYVVGSFPQAGAPVGAAPDDALGVKFLLIGSAVEDDSDADDEVVLTDAGSYSLVPGKLCVQCSVFSTQAGACGCSTPVNVDVTWVDPGDGHRLHRCPACSSRVSGDIVTRFVSGADAPGAVVATALYQSLPPSANLAEVLEPGQGRKLLTFSDSRQDAAFFAPFLERTYQRSVQRNLINSAIRSSPDEELGLGDVVTQTRKRAEQAIVIDPENTPMSNKNEVTTWLALEVLAFDRRISIEGAGLAEITVAVPGTYRTPQFLSELGFSEQEALDLILLLLGTLRLQGAVEMPDGVDIRDTRFEPRNRQIAVRAEGPDRGIVAWSPAKNTNLRLDVLKRVLERKHIEADAPALLKTLWQYLTDEASPWGERTWVRSNDPKAGLVHRLAWDRLRIQPAATAHKPSRCNRCRRLWWRTVADVCPGWKCEGITSGVDDLDELQSDHYASLYLELSPTALSVSEHTAQWHAKEASRLQDRFTKGKLNILSCSTTFELGVDVGDVQAVFLKNVPPTPANYVQRAGRAGRRADTAALVVTFAQRRSHDLTFFNNPSKMVNGVVDPPIIQLENAAIVRRHMHSVGFALFERTFASGGVAPHANVADFFDGEAGTTADVRFTNYLKQHPDELGASLERIVPVPLHAALGVTSWDWVEALTAQSELDPTFGWLYRAAAEARDDLDKLQSDYDDAYENHDLRRAQGIERMRKNIAAQPLISYLSRKNVLPKYGFPVDVVDLDVSGSGSDAASKVELSRDLKVALSEYAPGRQIVAGGRLWVSRGLRMRQGLDWLRYQWAVCGDCGAFRHQIGDTRQEICPRCESDRVKPGRFGGFIVPSFGFVGEDDGSPGQTRPPRDSRTESYFGAYKEDEPDFESVVLGPEAAEIETRTSRQGRIAVINRGPRGKGFLVCAWCGYVQVQDSTGKAKRKTSHPRLGRPGQECKGNLQFSHLGHEFLTDVLEIRVGLQALEPVLRSTLYSLIEGAAEIGIPRDDLDGTLNVLGSQTYSLVIFDAVPGGAGHAQKLSDNLREVVEAAYRRVANCPDCEPSTSCYSCLRSYSNQWFHDELRRGDAETLLGVILGVSEQTGIVGLDLVAEEVRDLLEGAIDLNAPMPTIGYELDNATRTRIELAWPTQRVAVVVGDDDARDQYLTEHGWTFGLASSFGPSKLANAILR